MRQPSGRMRSVPGQAAKKSHAVRSGTTSERPLHNCYVAEVCERATAERRPGELSDRVSDSGEGHRAIALALGEADPIAGS